MHETAAPIFLHSLPTPDPIHGPQLTGFPGRDDDLEELEAELREVALANVELCLHFLRDGRKLVVPSHNVKQVESL